MDKQELLKEIMKWNFTIIDMQLYLDTHSTDVAALKLFNDAVVEVRKLKAEYEQKFGMLDLENMSSTQCWDWANQGWPWEKMEV